MAITNPLTPAAVNFSKNFIPVKFQSDSYLQVGTNVIKDNYAIVVKILIDVFENDGIKFKTQELTTLRLPIRSNSAGMAETDFSELLHSYMEAKGPDFPQIGNISPKLCLNSLVRFSYKFGEISGSQTEPTSYTSSSKYVVMYGGLSYTGAYSNTLLAMISPDAANATKDRFLRQGNVHQYTRTNQPQFLYFFNSRTSKTVALKTRLVFSDASVLNKTVSELTLATLQKYCFNLTFDQIFSAKEIGEKQANKYEFWLEADGTKVSEVRTFYLNYEYREYIRYFLFWSCWGAIDTRLTYGKGNGEFELFQSEAKKIRKYGYQVTDGDSLAFDISLNSSYKVATGWMSKRELALNRDFFLSPFKYRYTGGNLLPIKITSKTIPEIADGSGLLAQQYEYKYLFDDDCYTEGDVEDNGDGIDGFFFNTGSVVNPSQGFQETDPTVPSWVKSITLENIARWNAGALIDLSNYYTKTDINTLLFDKVSFSSGAFIRNQSNLQANSSFHVENGSITKKLTIPTVAPVELQPGEAAFWIGNLSGISTSESYTLPKASADILGGVRIGSGLQMDPLTGVLSVTALGGVTAFNNRSGAISLLSVDVTSALGYTPYNSSNPSGYITAAALSSYARLSAIPTNNNQLANGSGYITAAALSPYALASAIPTNNNRLANGAGYITAAALNGYAFADNYYSKTLSDARFQEKENQRLSTGNNVVFNKVKAVSMLNIPTQSPANLQPGEAAFWIGNLSGITHAQTYNLPLATDAILGGVRIGSGLQINPITGVVSVTALGGVTAFNNRSGAISLQSSDVIGALGYTPYNSTNPKGYITASALSPFVLADGSNAVGPWSIDITGKAETAQFANEAEVAQRAYEANYWQGQFYDVNSKNNNISSILSYNRNTNMWSKTDAGQTLPYDISGKADTAQFANEAEVAQRANEATLWNGMELNVFESPRSNHGVLIWDGAINKQFRISSPELIKSWLGLGAAAYLNHSSGGIANQIVSLNGVGAFAAQDIYLISHGANLSSLVNKETLQSVTARGASTTNPLGINGGASLGEYSNFNASSTSVININGPGVVGGRFTVKIGGNIGINHPNPQYKLHVEGNGYFSSRLIARNTNDGSLDWNNAALEARGTNPAIAFHYPGIYGAQLYMDGSGSLIWRGAGLYSVGTIGVSGYGTYMNSGGMFTNDWFRSTGPTGWYSQTYYGGIYMQDYDWVRVYGGKKFRAENDIVSATKLQAPTIQATAKFLIPTAPPSSLEPGQAAMWIGNLSGISA